MHLQQVKRSTLSIFDDKRCSMIESSMIETNSKPWN